MAKLGILLYGYDEENAGVVKTALDDLLSENVAVLSGYGKEEQTVADILKAGPGGELAETEMKMLMFLGFSGDQIRTAMSGFPAGEGLPRPIFCSLTENNMGWPLRDLLEHLMEEDRYWRERKGEAGPGGDENG